MPNDFLTSSDTLPSGRKVYYAKLMNSPQPKFIIGYSTMYLGNTGLFNTKPVPGLIYDPAEYSVQHGFWSHFIYPTAMAESQGSYLCLNTYDRAKFTFSFMQYAVHVPNGDFVKFFKRLLASPNGANYFPKLVLQNNRIFYRNPNGGMNQLEDDLSTQKLMDYFNPGLTTIEDQELICSARMIHWATNDPEHRKIQVSTAVEHYTSLLKECGVRFGLNNAPAKVCQVVCDIRHQGRAMNDRIASALNTGGDYEKAYKNLLSIGETNYAERITTVKNTINKLITEGIFNKKYRQVDNTFVNL